MKTMSLENLSVQQVETYLAECRADGNDYDERQCQVVLCRTPVGMSIHYSALRDPAVLAAAQYLYTRVSDGDDRRPIRDAEDRYDRNQENSSAQLDGDAPGPRGVMWGDE